MSFTFLVNGGMNNSNISNESSILVGRDGVIEGLPCDTMNSPPLCKKILSILGT